MKDIQTKETQTQSQGSVRNILVAVERHGSLFLFSLFLLSLLLRFIVLSSFPSFIPTSDSGQWIALSREIRQSSLLIPATNSIHYPGSLWIYPPVVPYLLALISFTAGNSGLGMFYVTGSLIVIFESLIIFPLYYAVKTISGFRSAILSSSIFVGFPPFLYLISWTALPQIVAFLVLSCIIYVLSVISDRGTSTRKQVIVVSLLSFLLVFVHDLTAFVYAMTMFVLTAIYGFTGKEENPRRSALLKIFVISLIWTLIGLLIWYIPRLEWISQFTTLTSSSGVSGNLFSVIKQDAIGLSQPLAIYNMFSYASIILFILYILFVYLLVVRYRLKKSPILTISIVFLAVVVIAIPFTILFVRLSYFILFMYIFIASVAVPKLLSRNTDSSRRNVNAKRIFAVLMIVFIVLYSAWGVIFSYHAHSYYLSNSFNDQEQSLDAAKWIYMNVNHNDVIAASGGLGVFIMGYSGNPVIDYQNASFLSQSSEVNESNCAYVLIYNPLGETSNTMKIISYYNVSIVISNLGSSEVPLFYSLLYNSGNISIYSV